MIAPEQTGWLAGLFDGEGCVVRQIVRDKPIIGLGVSLTDRKAIVHAAKLVRSVIDVPVKVYELNYREGHKPRYGVEIRHTSNVLLLANFLLPLSVVKTKELKVIIAAGELMLRGREHPVGSTERARLSDKAVRVLVTGIPPRQAPYQRS